jgi:hypothetical protein
MPKMKSLLLVLGLLSCLTLGARAEVSTKSGTLIQSLDGEWQTAQDVKDAGKTAQWFDPAHFPTAAARPVQVPGALTEAWATSEWTRDAAKDTAWYLKTFSVEKAPEANMRYFLRFGAVTKDSEIWFNGTSVGAHEGQEDPFEFDVTSLVQPGKPNTVAVRLKLWNAAPVPIGGITQHVTLVAQPDVRILDAFARPDAKTGKIHLEVTLENKTSSAAQLKVNVALGEFKPAKSLGTQVATVTVLPGQIVAKIDLPVDHPHVWDLNDPFLYTIAITSDWKEAKSEAARHDTYSFRTGFRDFRMVDGYFTLNGRRIFLKSLHGNWYDPVTCLGTPGDMTWLSMDFPLLKKAGFNVMRFIVSAAYPEQLDQADELGFLIYSEHATSWLLKDPTKFGDTLNQVVRRDRNHPSLVLWGLLNETDNLDIYHRAHDWLPQLRAIDDTRPIILSSGRWDRDSKTASISNVGSPTWDVYLGGQDPENPKKTDYLRGMGDFGDVTGDDHIYPMVPMNWQFISNFARMEQDSPHPFFFSESGIGSLYNVFEEKRQMEKVHAPACSPSWIWINSGIEGVPKTWAAYGLNETYPNPEDAFIDSGLESAHQRDLLFSVIRSNPKVNGYNLTSLMDCWGGAEGIVDEFRSFKRGHLEMLQAGWAPLRWCLLVNPMNVYADAPLHVKAALANEDVLPGGDYPATIDIAGPSGVVWKQAVTAHVQQNGPLAYTLFDADVHIADLKEGAYTLEASLDGKPNAAAPKLAFTVTSRASLPTLTAPVTVAGVGQNIRDLLTKQGAKVRDYAKSEAVDRETIVVGPDFKGNASAWRALYARAARGAHIIFLANRILHDGRDRNKWLALPAKGDQSDAPDWLYRKEFIAKVNQPAFAGMPAKLLNSAYYGSLLAETSYFHGMTNPAPADTAAISLYDSFSGGPNYHDGVLLATYPLHKGHFTINTFNIVNSIGNPATDRLLLNLVVQAQADAAPLADLPVHYDDEMDKLGFRN